jgi:hypothetical protein
MRTVAIRSLVFSFALAFTGLYGQTTTISYVSSDYTVTMPSGFSGTNLSTVSLSVTYPVGLNPGQYISSTQFNADFQGYVSTYPSPNDPPEAILGSVLQSILGKYPQIAGGTLTGEIAGPGTTIGGITIPGAPSGTVIAAIGTFNSNLGIYGLNRTKPISNTSKPAPVKPTTAK